MKRERSDAAGSSPANPGAKVPDSASSIGFATIQESLDLKNEMDTYIKDLQKWKADYAAKEKATKLAKPAPRPPKPIQQQAGPQEHGMELEKMEKETADIGRMCEKEEQEISESKRRMQAMQKQKAELDRKLGASQISFESRGMVKEILRPLDDLQSQLKFSNDELMARLRIEDEKLAADDKAKGKGKKKDPAKSKEKEKKKEALKRGMKKETKKEEDTGESKKVSKILADLDKEMREIDSLLK